MSTQQYDIIILGSGPAGLTAALYASRALLATVVITGAEPGGQLTTTTEVENYPGFPNGIMGPQLMADMKTQVEKFGTHIKQHRVSSIEYRNNTRTFAAKGDGAEFEGRSVIIAIGASAQYLGLPSEDRLKGKGVSACATCDGFFFRGKDVVVIGGGDTAMEEAIFLTAFATKVTIIHRRDEFRASPIMRKRAQENPKIAFRTNSVVEEILGDTAVSGVRLKDTKTGTTSEVKTQGVFLAIGHKPNTEFLKGFVALDERGYIQLIRPASAREAQTRTSVPGVFAAGDCVDPRYRQAVVAAGMGCMAAMDAQKWLEDKGMNS